MMIGKPTSYLVIIKIRIAVVAVGMWAKASTSRCSERARNTGEAQTLGEADRPHVHGQAPSWT
jgi:hypothetical protein